MATITDRDVTKYTASELAILILTAGIKYTFSGINVKCAKHGALHSGSRKRSAFFAAQSPVVPW